MLRLAACTRWACPVIATFIALTPAALLAQSGRESYPDTRWWFHELVNPEAAFIDTLFNFILYLTVMVGVLVFIVGGVFLWKYRHVPGRRAAFIHGNNKLETVWTLIPTIILAVIAAVCQDIWSDMKFPREADTAAGDVEVHVIGMQFAWYFHYPGPDGVFGRRNPQPVGDNTAKIGLDRSDPFAKDDIIVPHLVVPKGKRIYITITSSDVIHSVFLPNFRIKQDAVPGLEARAWFVSDRTSGDVMGRNPNVPQLTSLDADFNEVTITHDKPFDIICAELCGNNHFAMRGQLFVVEQEAYEKFLATEAQQLSDAGSGAGEEGGEDDYGY